MLTSDEHIQPALLLERRDDWIEDLTGGAGGHLVENVPGLLLERRYD